MKDAEILLLTVEERVAHADGQPDEPDQACRESQCAGTEEGTNALAAEFGEAPLDDLQRGQLVLLDDIRVAADFVENLLGQPRLALVPVKIKDRQPTFLLKCPFLHHCGIRRINRRKSLLVRDPVDDGHGLGLSPAGEQEFGRLEEVEEEEARAEEAQGQGPHGVDEVSPALVHGVIDDEDPCDYLSKMKRISLGAKVGTGGIEGVFLGATSASLKERREKEEEEEEKLTERGDQLADGPPYG
jgi:hypothetical protein